MSEETEITGSTSETPPEELAAAETALDQAEQAILEGNPETADAPIEEARQELTEATAKLAEECPDPTPQQQAMLDQISALAARLEKLELAATETQYAQNEAAQSEVVVVQEPETPPEQIRKRLSGRFW